jgi:hypothetical protein
MAPKKVKGKRTKVTKVRVKTKAKKPRLYFTVDPTEVAGIHVRPMTREEMHRRPFGIAFPTKEEAHAYVLGYKQSAVKLEYAVRTFCNEWAKGKTR